MPATIPAVSVTMAITKKTLLEPLFVFKSPSLLQPLLKLKSVPSFPRRFLPFQIRI